MKSVSHRKAILLLILTAALWSTGGVFIKLLDWGPLGIMGMRGPGVFLVLFLFLRRIDLQFSWPKTIGAISYVLVQLTFVAATQLTTAANAIFLQYTAPLYVVLFGYMILKEQPRRADWITMLFLFMGLLLFFGDQLSLKGFYGNVMGLLSGVTMAAITLSLRAQKNASPAQSILLGSLLSVFVGLPFMFSESWTIKNIAILVYLGLFQLGLAYLFYTIAIRYVPALEATLILALEPVLNPVWVFLVIGETPGSLALFGGILVLAAVVFRAIAGKNHQELDEAVQPVPAISKASD